MNTLFYAAILLLVVRWRLLYTINQNLSNNCSAVKEEKIKITFSVLESTARMGKGLLFLKGYSFSFDVICEMKYYYKGGEPMR